MAVSSNQYTTDELVESIKIQISSPTSNFRYSDSEIIRLMNIEQNANVVPFINSLREDYFVVNDDLTLVAGQDEYDIPTRSIGNKLRYVCYVNNIDGTSAPSELDCPRLAIEQVGQQSMAFPTFNFLFGHVVLYDKVKLYNRNGQTPISNGFNYLRLKYYRKPNDLVANIYSTTVSSVTDNIVVMGSIPPGWEVGTSVDFISQYPIFRSTSDDNIITDISTNTVTFSADVGDDVAAGQYACESGFTPIPQYPVEVINLLTECTVMKICMGTGDVNGLQVSSENVKMMKAALAAEFTPRNEGNLKTLFSNRTIYDF